MKKILSILSLMLLLTGCGSQTASTSAPESKGIKDVTVAFLPNEGSVTLSPMSQMLVDEIQKALGDGYAVKGVVVDDYAAVTEAMLTGTAQIAWESGATFAKTNMEDSAIIPLVTYGVDGKLDNASYTAYIATNIDNKADFEGKTRDQKLEQLKGKSFSFVSATSTSGRLVPTTSLYLEFGPEGRKAVTSKSQIFEKTDKEGGIFSEIMFGGNHPGSVLNIVDKKAYAGAFCCQYGKDAIDKLYIIDQVQVPNGPLWVNSKYIDADMQAKITEHFVKLTPETSVEGFFADDEKGFFWESDGAGKNRFIKVPDGFYDFVFKMYQD